MRKGQRSNLISWLPVPRRAPLDTNVSRATRSTFKMKMSPLNPNNLGVLQSMKLGMDMETYGGYVGVRELNKGNDRVRKVTKAACFNDNPRLYPL